jgi:chaperonin GroEL
MKRIDFNAREAIISAVESLAVAVGSTLGAGGRNVLLQLGPQYAITKDGVTVARQIEFEDETENAVAQIVKEAAARTARDAGDGTTTSTVLVYEMVNRILNDQSIDEVNVTRVRAGIEEAAKDLIDIIEKSKKEVTTDRELKSIATVSGNNDESIGNMMLEVFNSVGKEGAVRLEETSMNKTVIDVAKGCQVDAGYANPNFANNVVKRVADYKDPAIFITDKKFEGSFTELIPVLEVMFKMKKPKIIICGGIEGEPLGSLVNNKIQQNLDIVAIEAPHFGTERMDILDDIAATTGGVVVSEARGFNIADVTEEQIGTADRIVVDGTTTTIIGRHGSEEAINERLKYIGTQKEEDREGNMAWRFNQRVASLTSGVGVIYVGGNSEAEMKDMYYRLEDSLSATQAAMSHGYVLGGGMAYYNAAKKLEKKRFKDQSRKLGYMSMVKAAKKPVEWIMRNAGHQGAIPAELGLLGYNAVTCELSDIEKDGIIDPFKVVESCISNAASVAGMLITTNVIITDERKRK